MHPEEHEKSEKMPRYVACEQEREMEALTNMLDGSSLKDDGFVFEDEDD
jgi:hypothetical protein